MNILVAGAGYLGLSLAVSLKKQGHRVLGWTYSAESAHLVTVAGIEAISGDLADENLWRSQPAWDAIFYCASTSGGGVESYRHVHQLGLRLALQFLAPGREGCFFYTSSTSVYGQSEGSEVDETSPTEPLTESGRILLDAEKQVLAKGGTVLRLSGIYGPQRCAYLQKIRNGRAILPAGTSRWVNQIHRDDALSALLHLWKHPVPGQVWNVSDDGAVSLENLYRWICKETGSALPGEGGIEGVRKRGSTNKRVLNGKLRKAGWVPMYPTFREGYAELIRSGQL